jgi:hypothetical protein
MNVRVCESIKIEVFGRILSNPEMKFLDINLTKDSSLLLSMSFTVFFTSRFYRKPYSSLVLKILISETRKLESIQE